MATILICIIIAICAVLLIQSGSPMRIGRRGEASVSRKLRTLNTTNYRILDDVMLPSRGNSGASQIDHIVVSNYGIFCIETKAYKGWIFGDAKQKQWTQVIYRYKGKFYNPVRQNFAHVSAINDLLGRRLKRPVVSLVIFTHADKIKIYGTNSVGHLCDLAPKIKSYAEQVFSDLERDEIYMLLTAANIIDKKSRQAHTSEVRNLKFTLI